MKTNIKTILTGKKAISNKYKNTELIFRPETVMLYLLQLVLCTRGGVKSQDLYIFELHMILKLLTQ